MFDFVVLFCVWFVVVELFLPPCGRCFNFRINLNSLYCIYCGGSWRVFRL